jgi:hypothetical protein
MILTRHQLWSLVRCSAWLDTEGDDPEGDKQAKILNSKLNELYNNNQGKVFLIIAKK